MYLSVLSGKRAASAGFDESTLPTEVPKKATQLWQLVTAILDEAKVDISQAVPDGRLGLSAVYDSSARKYTGIFKLRIAKKYQTPVTKAVDGDLVVESWPKNKNMDRLVVGRDIFPAKVLEQNKAKLGVNATSSTLGLPRGYRSFSFPISAEVRQSLSLTGFDLGQAGNFSLEPVNEKVTMEDFFIFGPTGVGSAGRDTAAALAGFLDISSDELEISECREVSRGFSVFNIAYPYTDDRYDLVYDLFDAGSFAVINLHKPRAKKLEVFCAPNLIELGHVSGVKLTREITNEESSEDGIKVLDMTSSTVGTFRLPPLDTSYFILTPFTPTRT